MAEQGTSDGVARPPVDGDRGGRVSDLRRMKAARLAAMKAEREKEERVDNREGTLRKPTGLVYDERMLLHECSWDKNHIESPLRLSRIWERCRVLGLVDRCVQLPARAARDDELNLYHSNNFIGVIEGSKTLTPAESETLCEGYDSVYLCNETAEAARLAAAAGIDLVDAVLAGDIHCGIGLVRPPGHHAMRDELNGFCGFNNVVLAAHKALNSGVKKILIVDFDLHHGQGVQRAFYSDPRVLYMSVHRYEDGAYWPHLRESNFDHVGEGDGRGFNVNVPLNVIGCGNSEYLAIFQQIFLPVATEFAPELVLISAGYDAAIGCPEGCMRVTPAAYSQLVSSLSGLAGGRLVVMLEGGYCLDSLEESAALTLRTLLGDCAPSLPSTSDIHPSVIQSIIATTAALRPYWKTLQIRQLLDPSDMEKFNLHYPAISFKPPPDFPPDKFPTRDYYLVFDPETERKMSLEIAHINLATRLRTTETKVSVFYDEEMCRHKDDCPHPESPERIQRIYMRLKESGFLDEKNVIELPKGRRLKQDEATLVHSMDHWENILATSSLEAGEMDELAETFNSIFLNQFSADCALLSGGGVLTVLDSVMAESRAGIAVVRPPGHHAEEDEPHGFCLFNNVGIAAQYAISVHGLSRVLILDWDVHHGNGIQHMFYNSEKVLYVSIHRYDQGYFFPCSPDAAADKTGEGPGTGFNINIPWNSRRCGDLEYFLAFMNIVLPTAYEFNPELVLVSAGFDAARGDPLGGYKVSPEMYGHMTHHLTTLAEGRVVIALEGGYNLGSISESMYMCARGLRGDPLPPLDLSAPLREDVVDTLREVLEVQQDHWKSLENTTVPLPENVEYFSKLAEKSAAQSVSPENISLSMTRLVLMEKVSLSSNEPAGAE